MDKEKDRLDAGLRSLNHYKIRLPRWRYQARERILPAVRWETPYLAWFQEKMRSPALDTYFAISANLGTHTFFMVMLPIVYWCGYTSLARAMVHILASGVFFSGFFKDLLCLPRPLSPPLQRITMSGSAALEYGFPSTHSTNAASVAVYALFVLNFEHIDMSPITNAFLQTLAYLYALSIIFGRLYCGMHGFLDVIIGSLLGAVLSLVECQFGDAFNDLIHSGTGKEVLVVILIIFVLVRIHPEPADDCPCFDDSVAFAGVMVGIEFGNWHFAKTRYAWSSPYAATIPFDLEQMGWIVAIIRIALGVTVIFAWRGMMKPTLLRILPPVFRVVEGLGLTLPRRFFKQASEYKKVPKEHNDDNIIPSVSEIPQMLTNFRRRRAVSIGPQSEADVYEALAYREKKRRDSLSSLQPSSPVNSTSASDIRQISPHKLEFANGFATTKTLPDTPSSGQTEGSMGSRAAPTSTDVPISTSGMPSEIAGTDFYDVEDKDLFLNLQKPRVRYDVEVVTKLIVYSGIAWLAVEGNPILFQIVGLGI